jgi:hypothetical protein
MKKAAVDKASERLGKARDCIERIKASHDFPSFSSAWTDFLLAANGIYTALELGATENARARQWFGRKKAERRTDPLLRYVHQARNADEHGLEPIAEHVGGSLAIGVSGPGFARGIRLDGSLETGLRVQSLDGLPVRIQQTFPHPKLITVHDSRFGDSFDPPTSHLGNDLPNDSPFTVASFALAYLSSLVDEASKLT